MSDIAVEELARLRGFARRRLKNPNGQQLCHHLDQTPWEAAIASDAPLAPWEMSLGYHTPLWATLDEEQRLALNHWTYVMMYFRIGDGERFVVLVNDAIADFLAQEDAEVSALLRLESNEEVDHIAASCACSTPCAAAEKGAEAAALISRRWQQPAGCCARTGRAPRLPGRPSWGASP